MDRWERELRRADRRRLHRPHAGGRHRPRRPGPRLHLPLPHPGDAAAAGLPAEDVPTFYRRSALITNVAARRTTERLRRRTSADSFRTVIADRRRASRRTTSCRVLVARRAQAARRHPPGADRGRDRGVPAPARAGRAPRRPTGRCRNLLFGLLTHPDQLAALRDDRSLMRRRHRGGAPLGAAAHRRAGAWRRADAVARRRARARPGCPVNIAIGAANHDPSRWTDPERFDIHRRPQPHMAFGDGPHICLGIHFARMEMRVALETLLDRLPNLRLDPDAEDVHITGLIRAPRSRCPSCSTWSRRERAPLGQRAHRQLGVRGDRLVAALRQDRRGDRGAAPRHARRHRDADAAADGRRLVHGRRLGVPGRQGRSRRLAGRRLTDSPTDELAAARTAAVREAAEEAGVAVEPDGLVWFAHWTPPPAAPKRFATWFFVAPASEAHDLVTIDGSEITEHAWLRPSVVLERHAAGEVDLAPPTWLTLHRLLAFASSDGGRGRRRRPGPRRARDPDRPHRRRRRGPVGGRRRLSRGRGRPRRARRPRSRHRLWMAKGAWTYERTE